MSKALESDSVQIELERPYAVLFPRAIASFGDLKGIKTTTGPKI